jgi:hypothetical protein
MNLKLLLLSLLCPFFSIGQKAAAKLPNPAKHKKMILKRKAIHPYQSIDLDKKVSEASGLVFWNGQLWTHNDSGNAASLFAIDTLDGHLIKEYTLPRITNNDWEEISQDDRYFYMGDFGNNRGKRDNVVIIRIEKEPLLKGQAKMENIVFSWPETKDRSGKSLKVNFNCEAMVVLNDSIYLFTKEKNPKATGVYALSKEPGMYTAHLKDHLKTDFLVTGASYSEKTGHLVLCGYDLLLHTFVLDCYGFEGTDFFSAKMIQRKVRRSFRQTEGIATNNAGNYFLVNEHFYQPWLLDRKQQLHKLKLGTSNKFENVTPNYVSESR